MTAITIKISSEKKEIIEAIKTYVQHSLPVHIFETLRDSGIDENENQPEIDWEIK